jgi:hypothetical protein
MQPGSVETPQVMAEPAIDTATYGSLRTPKSLGSVRQVLGHGLIGPSALAMLHDCVHSATAQIDIISSRKYPDSPEPISALPIVAILAFYGEWS